MNRIIKTLLFIGITYSIFGQTKNYIDQPYLETTANIDTLVTPDLIYLKIILNEDDKRNRVSIKDMETKLFQKLESLGINLPEQLMLFDFASNFKKYIFQSKKIIKEKVFSLKLYDTKTAGKVLEDLEEINISNINLYECP